MLTSAPKQRRPRPVDEYLGPVLPDKQLLFDYMVNPADDPQLAAAATTVWRPTVIAGQRV